MPASRLFLSEPLLLEEISGSDGCRRRVLPLLVLLVCSVFPILLSSLPFAHARLHPDELPIAMARHFLERQKTWNMQPMRALGPVALAPFGFLRSMKKGWSAAAHGSDQFEPAGHRPSGLESWTSGPAKIQSGQGRIAYNMLKDNSRLFDAQVEAQLEALRKQIEEDEKKQQELQKTENKAADESSRILRQRMEEVLQRELQNERALVAMDLIYLKVCSKLKHLQIPMIPTMKEGGDVKFDDIDLKGLTSRLYTKEALELVNERTGAEALERLFKTLSGQAAIVPDVLHISLFEAAGIYARSAVFGYSLRNFDRRFQLEKMARNFGAPGGPMKSLLEYMSSFGVETVQDVTSIPSMESRNAMELHVAALFGDHGVLKEQFVNALDSAASQEELEVKLAEAISANKVHSIRITNEDMTRMILEAVAFGTLLNDAEKQVDAIYQLTTTDTQPAGYSSNTFLSDKGEA
eukprot:gnl/TRDRNA2_/TRDRNA2_69790_c0_seq1.p1 gnl/TRDRNA2_/TRDRNA2_69790_c0~~gnl/TRDRNA2_/TRDRNA2_69790_c0_seq1.p1  ORF type:complete len:486 (+),score=102.32 gnl/TRDRNA2_/TRDRNA2_69790_c0_seq1:66-1460(+)